MARYGETFLTKPRWYWDVAVYEDWINTSRFVFRPSFIEGWVSLSWLGIINGTPLQKWFRLAAMTDLETEEIKAWKVIRCS